MNLTFQCMSVDPILGRDHTVQCVSVWIRQKDRDHVNRQGGSDHIQYYMITTTDRPKNTFKRLLSPLHFKTFPP